MARPRRVKPRAPIRSRTQSLPGRPGMVVRPVRKRTPHLGVLPARNALKLFRKRRRGARRRRRLIPGLP